MTPLLHRFNPDAPETSRLLFSVAAEATERPSFTSKRNLWRLLDQKKQTGDEPSRIL